MAVFNFKSAVDPESFRKELASTFAKDPNFSWAKEIVELSTEQYIAANLRPIKKNAYAPWRIEENIFEAGRLLDNSMDKRREIMELEAQAIQTALELDFSQQVQSHQLALDIASLQAARSEAGDTLPEGAGDTQTLKDRDQLLSDSRITQYSFHRTAGGALNYGERVSALREFLAENIAITRDRFFAIRLGCASAFGFEPDPLPEWTVGEAGPDALLAMVKWLRNTTRHMDEGLRGEIVQTVDLYLGRDAITNVNPMSVSSNPITLNFTLNRAHFPGVDVTDSVRLIGINAAIWYPDPNTRFAACASGSQGDREMFQFSQPYISRVKQMLTVPITVSLPNQVSSLSDLNLEDRSWNHRPMRIEAKAVTPDWVNDPDKVYHTEQIVNAQVFGEWSINIDGNTTYPWAKVPREWAGLGTFWDGNAAGMQALARPDDVVLRLQLAIRPKP